MVVRPVVGRLGVDRRDAGERRPFETFSRRQAEEREESGADLTDSSLVPIAGALDPRPQSR